MRRKQKDREGKGDEKEKETSIRTKLMSICGYSCFIREYICDRVFLKNQMPPFI